MVNIAINSLDFIQ